QDKVAEIIDNRGHKAKYTYDNNSNLVQVVDSNSQIYLYKYENKKFPHLLTRIEYVSESTPKDRVYRELRYDDAGLVVFHHDRDGSEVTYTYGRNSNDPENNFWTKMVRKNHGVTEENYDEFFIKARTDGTK